MLALDLRDQHGAATGAAVQFDESVLGATINRVLLRQVLNMYSGNMRVGTVKSKSRAEVSGSSKKLYKQKGTGNARAGNKRTPVRRGGGHCFAKRPVEWRTSMPRKSVRAATAMAILAKMRAGKVVVFEPLSLVTPKTSVIASFLSSAGVSDSRSLIVTAGYDRAFWISSRNIPYVSVSPAAEMNADVIMRADVLLISRDALGELASKFSTRVA